MTDSVAPTPASYGRATSPPLCTIALPTFERAPRLARCLEQFTRVLAASSFRTRLEVVVSDNASTDGTAEVLRTWGPRLGAHCPVRVFTQPRNIGPEANFVFLDSQARGDYVWMCSDDDLLVEAEIDRLFTDLGTHRPAVCLSSFLQPPWTETEHIFMCAQGPTETVTSLENAVKLVTRYPKITCYVYRRLPFDDADRAACAAAAERTAFWHVARALRLLTRSGAVLLIRTANIGRSDSDWRQARYSLRVYETLREAVRLGLGGHPDALRLTTGLAVPDVRPAIVGNLFRRCVGLDPMDPIAREDFAYMRTHLRSMLGLGWRSTVKLPLVLMLFPVAERLRRPGGPMRLMTGRS